jgi:hypothetical protein
MFQEMLRRWREPVFPTSQDAERIITNQLRGAIPSGWRWTRCEGENLAWKIVKEQPSAGEWPNQDYRLFITRGLDYLILTHGNNDVGCVGLHHFLQQALVIETAALRGFDLAACLRHLRENYKPNEWGYT